MDYKIINQNISLQVFFQKHVVVHVLWYQRKLYCSKHVNKESFTHALWRAIYTLTFNGKEKWIKMNTVIKTLQQNL